jgi:hypothetical protein
MVGEHTHDILTELGFAPREIDALEEERVIQRATA